MEHIIQQIALKLAKDITEKALISENFDIDALSDMALEDCKVAAISIIETITTEMNKEIRQDKSARKELGLIIKEKDRQRNLLVSLGELNLKRDYYYDKINKRYTVPLDAVLGIEPFVRAGKNVSARLVEAATEYSYAKSAKIVIDGKVSRQTVRNKILKAPELEVVSLPLEKKAVKELHVFADEDHVHLQKPNKEKGKRNRIVPLVTVTEGITGESARRNSTINPMHFVDTEFDTANLWEAVDGYIRTSYDVEEIEKIYVHGDGGNWILNGLNEYEQTKHVMDGYHLGKQLRALNSKFPGLNARYRIEKAISADDRKKANEIVDGLMKHAHEPKQMMAAETAKVYLNNKWDEIVNRRILDIPGSCTEGQVSHILSERFSRNPMGWSKEGLGKLSKLRVYVKNGGKIKGEHFRKDCPEDTGYVGEMIKNNVSGCFDWSIFDEEPMVFDKSSGTQILLEMYGQQNDWIFS